MELRRRRKRRGGLVSKVALFSYITSIFLFFVCALISTVLKEKDFLDISIRGSSSVDSYTDQEEVTSIRRTRSRRQLAVSGGPGSYPPRCTSKCGDCAPCFPVHVPVPPGTPVTTEYYPEAWRCKCGNKLYMP